MNFETESTSGTEPEDPGKYWRNWAGTPYGTDEEARRILHMMESGAFLDDEEVRVYKELLAKNRGLGELDKKYEKVLAEIVSKTLRD